MEEDNPDIAIGVRKIGKRGDRQYIIGLPLFWIHHNSLKKGSKILVVASPNGKDLILKQMK